VLWTPLTHDHLSAISGITSDGRLFMQTQEQAYHSPEVVRFLRLLLRKIQGKLVVIWDGSPIHRGQPIKDFLRRGAARRLHLEQWPAYAPELNPDEGIGNYLKRVDLANICCSDLATLRPRHARAGVAPRQGASASQAHRHPGVLHTGGLQCLAIRANVSKRTTRGRSAKHRTASVKRGRAKGASWTLARERRKSNGKPVPRHSSVCRR
jgi:transposase